MVKAAFTAFLSILCFGSIAQTNSMQVVEASKTPILVHGKKPIGDLITIVGLHSYVFLKDCHQIKDSSGNYRTDFEFGNPNRIIAYHITIILQFDRTVDSIIFTSDGVPKDLKTTFAPNNVGASYQASELPANATITATIYSKRKVFTSITGVEGQLH